MNCPSKKPTAAIFGFPHFGVRVAGKPQSAESATGQLAYAALRSRPAELLQQFDGLPKRTRRPGRVDQDAADAFAAAILPEWPDGNTCAGIRSTYSCWIGGSQLQGIVEPNG